MGLLLTELHQQTWLGIGGCAAVWVVVWQQKSASKPSLLNTWWPLRGLKTLLPTKFWRICAADKDVFGKLLATASLFNLNSCIGWDLTQTYFLSICFVPTAKFNCEVAILLNVFHQEFLKRQRLGWRVGESLRTVITVYLRCSLFCSLWAEIAFDEWLSVGPRKFWLAEAYQSHYGCWHFYCKGKVCEMRTKLGLTRYRKWGPNALLAANFCSLQGCHIWKKNILQCFIY